jgi:hypothetical protein
MLRRIAGPTLARLALIRLDTFLDDCRRDWMSISMPHQPSSDLAEQAIHKPAGRWIAEALVLGPDDGDISAALPIVYPLRW